MNNQPDPSSDATPQTDFHASLTITGLYVMKSFAQRLERQLTASEADKAKLVAELEKAKAQFEKARQWNSLSDLQIKNLQSIESDQDECISWLEQQREVEIMQREKAETAQAEYLSERDTLRAELATGKAELARVTTELDSVHEAHHRASKGEYILASEGEPIQIGGMAWTKPEYGHHTVDKAGKLLLSDDPFAEFDDALKIINNWRSSHGYPLQSIKMTLLQRAKGVHPSALVAERRKRIPAIELKLRNNPSMQLSKMHDIGGCRGVLPTVFHVEKLVKLYEDAISKNPRRGGIFVKKYDYIQCPKRTGYRSVHLVYKYKSDSEKLKIYDGLRIEIQIRSKIQHLWATAVETVDMFTTQALKSDMGTATWKRFFALAASAFALIEKRPLVPDTPLNIEELRIELKKFSHQITLMEGFQKATEIMEGKVGKIFLLELDSKTRKIKTTGFGKESLLRAQEMCLEIEKVNKDFPERQVVLVSVQSMNALPKAYPNFFLDISAFVALIKKTIGD